MADFNRVFLIGRLTQDPEIRYTSSGVPVTDLRLATGRRYTTADGEPREETLYIDCTVWKRQAENCCQFLKKGSPIHVEGYLKQESWEDRNSGEKRSKIKVEAINVQFLDSRRSTDDPGREGGYEDSPPRDPSPPRRAPSTGDNPGEFRGSNGTGGPPRGFSGTGSPPPRRPTPPPPPRDDDQEDIPF